MKRGRKSELDDLQVLVVEEWGFITTNLKRPDCETFWIHAEESIEDIVSVYCIPQQLKLERNEATSWLGKSVLKVLTHCPDDIELSQVQVIVRELKREQQAKNHEAAYWLRRIHKKTSTRSIRLLPGDRVTENQRIYDDYRFLRENLPDILEILGRARDLTEKELGGTYKSLIESEFKRLCRDRFLKFSVVRTLKGDCEIPTDEERNRTDRLIEAASRVLIEKLGTDILCDGDDLNHNSPHQLAIEILEESRSRKQRGVKSGPSENCIKTRIKQGRKRYLEICGCSRRDLEVVLKGGKLVA